MPATSPTNPPTADAEIGQRWLRTAWIAWAVFASALVVKCVADPDKHSVYPCFELAANNWWSDQRMYDHKGIPSKERTGYRYSPTFAIAVSPLAQLPRGLGAAGWCLINVGCLFWSLKCLRRELLPRWTPKQDAVFLLLALLGSARGLWSAQSNSLVFALAAFAAVAVSRQQWWRAGHLLAAGIFVKLWPIAVALLFLACWPRQLIARTALSGLAIAAVPFFTRPFSIVCTQYAGWYGFLTGVGQHRWQAYRDLWSTWEHVVGPVVGWYATVVQLAAAICVLMWCLRARRMGSVPHLLLTTLCAWACWQLLVGPGTERNTYGLLAPMMAWAVVHSFEAGRLCRLTSWACALYLAFTLTGSLERSLQPLFPAAEALVPLGTALLVVWMLLEERHRDRASAELLSATGSAPVEAVMNHRGVNEAA